MSSLNISPIDGRYAQHLTEFFSYFSEHAYIKQRVQIEIKYLIFLSKQKITPALTLKEIQTLSSIYTDFSPSNTAEVKQFESITNHDIKAIEYYIQKKCTDLHFDKLTSFIHWGITSDDTNNLAYGMALTECNRKCMIPLLQTLIGVTQQIAIQNKNSLLLARTHGQPAVPTTFGKELSNFSARLTTQLKKLEDYPFEGKLMGAVGNLNAHKRAFPNIKWVEKSMQFVRSLGLHPNIHGTQILPYDNWIGYFQILSTINGILSGLARDIWTYIMLEEVRLKKKEGEVGSSTMPQKVNPIDFENAEGNCAVANSYFDLYGRTLLSSRLQRDLSDSTIKRTFGTALSHTFLAWKSIERGLHKIEFDTESARIHLNNHYEVLAEAIQTTLRLKNDSKGYEKVKNMMRGKKMDKKLYQAVVRTLGLIQLVELTPEKYVGYAEELVVSN